MWEISKRRKTTENKDKRIELNKKNTENEPKEKWTMQPCLVVTIPYSDNFTSDIQDIIQEKLHKEKL